MKKTLTIYCTLAVISVAFGVWLRWRMYVPFTGFKGEYRCAGFGMPTEAHNVLDFRFVEDNKVDVNSIAHGVSQKIGRLYLESSSLGRLEFESEVIHSSSSTINPLAEHFIEGHGKEITIIGRDAGKDIYRFSCKR